MTVCGIRLDNNIIILCILIFCQFQYLHTNSAEVTQFFKGCQMSHMRKNHVLNIIYALRSNQTISTDFTQITTEVLGGTDVYQLWTICIFPLLTGSLLAIASC
jgi:hypothetical protein